MGRRRITDPNIYQVDLVAGLFGGFLLVWLASALADETPPADYSPLLVTVRATLGNQSLADFGTTDARCLRKSEISKLELNIGSSKDCPEKIALYPNHIVDLVKIVAPTVIPECDSASQTINVTVNRTTALHLSPPSDWRPMAFLENDATEKPSTEDAKHCHLTLHSGGYTAVYVLPQNYSLSSLQNSPFEYDRSNISISTLWTPDNGDARRAETARFDESNKFYPKALFQGQLSLRMCGYQRGAERCFNGMFGASKKSGTINLVPEE